jgi:NAD(P) transhydrogenase subunit alpha
MKIAIPNEVAAGERRVALVPESVVSLVKAGLEVCIQAGAGKSAFLPDSEYEKAGAKIIADTGLLLGEADVVVRLQKPAANEIELLRPGALLICFFQPAIPELVNQLKARKITVFAMESIPRVGRAQAMDALSSQASLAGYKAVLIAAGSLGKYFPMLMTAAGTVAPAKVLVLGAGVAGLQAIATARRLGAMVWGYDVRPVVKEQVESLGAKFLKFDLGDQQTQDKGGYARELSPEAKRKQQEMLAEKTKEFDVVITTALIPGKPAPLLITKETVAAMRPGSVIVDLAAETGGNCELTQPGKDATVHGVTIHGPLNLPSTMPIHASQLYSRNVTALLMHLVRDGRLNLDFNDEITKGACITGPV